MILFLFSLPSTAQFFSPDDIADRREELRKEQLVELRRLVQKETLTGDPEIQHKLFLDSYDEDSPGDFKYDWVVVRKVVAELNNSGWYAFEHKNRFYCVGWQYNVYIYFSPSTKKEVAAEVIKK